MRSKRKVIRSFTGPYFFLSNFYQSIIVVPSSDRHGGRWKTAEHLFQALKTDRLDEIAAIRDAPVPGAAKKLGRRVHLREDWEEIKVDVMRNVIAWKFPLGSHDNVYRPDKPLIPPVITQKLLDTDEATLIEGNYWNDTFWGQCRGKGENHLGVILMERRDKAREFYGDHRLP